LGTVAENYRQLLNLLDGLLTLYVLLFSYIIAVYSVISAVAALILFFTSSYLKKKKLVRFEKLRQPLLFCCFFFLWKPYPVEVNSFLWRVSQGRTKPIAGDILRVYYYEPHAFRTRITFEPDDEKRTVGVRVWASYFPIDIFLLDHVNIVIPPQGIAEYKYYVVDQFEEERIRWL
jgi:hypothetical protein